MTHTSRILTALLFLAVGAAAQAGGGPENVALVVNADSWASLAVANEFIAQRHIPASNVIYLTGISHWDHVPIDYFRDHILTPVLTELQNRGLAGQLDYLIYSSDLPTKADAWADLTGAQALDQMPRHCPQPWLATTALTYLYPLTLAKHIGYLDLGANRYARMIKQDHYDDAPWTDDQRRQFAAAQQFFKENEKRAGERTKNKPEATPADLQWIHDGAVATVTALSPLADQHPGNVEVLYNLACAYALAGQAPDALRILQQASTCGLYALAGTMAGDSDLAAVRDLPDFRALVEKLRAAQYQTFDSHGFRGTDTWTREGPQAPGQPGLHYLLSTALAVTSGRGNSVTEALGCLRRSASADGTRPVGTIYFMRNGDVRSTTRSWAFPSVVSQLQALGVKAEIVDGVLPQKRADCMGVMAGSADFNWPASGSTILPGAICEHLTSYGGVMESWGGQTPISEWMRAGAAGSSGTVAEPLAIFNKFPNPWIQVHYAHGCSLAEAFYQSVPAPFHLLIVGDPLCQPWAQFPPVRVTGVSPGDVVTGKLSLVVAPEAQGGLGHIELFVDGIRQASGAPNEPLGLDTAPLREGWHELRVVAVAAGPIETQNREIIPIFVRSNPTGLQLVPEKPESPLDQPLKLTVSMPGALAVLVVCNRRPLGRVIGAQGTLTVDPRALGMGAVEVQPVAIMPPGREVGGAPVTVHLVAPAPWPAQTPPVGLQKGLRLQAGSQPPVILDKLDLDALAGKAKAFEQFQIEAWFSAPADDLYQFQMRIATGQVTLRVDGHDLGKSVEGAWAYLPVSLQTGWHRVTIVGVPEPPVGLEVNYGGQGTWPLAGPGFQCVVEK